MPSITGAGQYKRGVYMRFGNAEGPRTVSRAGMVFFALANVGHLFFPVSPAYAIPSPELVIGSLSSLSQLVAIGSAMLGGAASVVAGRTLLRGGRTDRGSRLGWKVSLGLLLFGLVAVALNAYQLINYRSERAARLEATLLRPALMPGVAALDPEVKELSFSQQQKHPLGITTEESQKLLDAVKQGQRRDVLFLDVREAAESEMGILPGSHPVRFPDFSSAAIDTSGMQVILYCHNGNRSHETCEALKEKGIDCRFMVGGVEKWVVEQRLLTNLNARTLDTLRAVPPYRNQRTLLDTPEVHQLVNTEGASFVDVRYAKDFAGGHLPGAINLAIRRTPTGELGSRLAELPKVPIVLPCYDRRGCFFAEVLGLEMSRAGHDVRGRYTVPWEYAVAGGRPPHVEQWIAENQLGWWARAVRNLAKGLAKVSEAWGLLAAIVLLALASRLLVLPLSWKADRDQLVARQISGQVDTLKARLKHDPARLARAMRTLYGLHGLTPVRNLLALVFLPALALSIAAVQQVATAEKPRLSWIPNLAERDPFLVLPLAMAIVLAIYVHIAITSNRKHRMMLWGIALPLMAAGGAMLSAAANIYVLSSAVLLLAQRAVIGGVVGSLLLALERWCARLRRRLGPVGVVHLRDPEGLVGCGNKAYRLAQLRAHGFPVPEGLVLTPRFLAPFATGSKWWRRRQLNWIWRQLGGGRVAVRSSAAAEDGAGHSFGGVFESILNVARADLAGAIEKVDASFAAARVESYGVEADGRNILVQKMVAPEYAGVLFTRDPAAAGCMMVELVQGLGDQLVSGLVQPDAYRFGRNSKRLVGSPRPPIDLEPLLNLGCRAEQLFSRPQDIEWAYLDGRFFILQSRDITAPITALESHAAVQHEWVRVMDRGAGAVPEETIFAQNEMTEVLPQPTPLSLSLMEAMWASGGSVDLACRSLGMVYKVEEDSPSYLVPIFGRLYADRRQEQMRAPELGALTVRRLKRGADRIEADFREKFLPVFLGEVAVLEAVAFDRLATTALFEMVQRLHDNFVTLTHVEVDIINIATKFYLDEARKALGERGLDVASCLSVVPETVAERVIAEAARAKRRDRQDLLLAGFSHRAVLDYELQAPRYAESPQTLDGLMGLVAARANRSPATAGHEIGRAGAGGEVAKVLERARRFQTLKEDAKHHSLRELAVLRRAILALDRRLGLNGLAFYLTFAELLSISDRPLTELRATAEQRGVESRLFGAVAPLPAALSIVDLEVASRGERDETKTVDDVIGGQRVSGVQVVEGRACVVEREVAEGGAAIEDFQDGDIIVSPMIHPAWLPYVLRAGGLASEIGGWLSHMAIIAREYNLPMIVKVGGLRNIQHGQIIRLHADGTIEAIGDEREEERLAEAAE